MLVQRLQPIEMHSPPDQQHAMTTTPRGMTQSGRSSGGVTGAARLMRAIADVTDVCFANPGTTEMWLVSALDSLPSVKPVLCLHETVCTGAADGYARMARRPAMALLHLGPGLANAVANLHNARRARSPMLCVVGDMATWHSDADPLLAMDIPALAGTVSKVVAQAQAATAPDLWTSSVPQLLHTLTSTTSTTFTQPPGWTVTTSGPQDSRVVTLVIPHDLSWEETDIPRSVSGPVIHTLGTEVQGLSLGVQGSPPHGAPVGRGTEAAAEPAGHQPHAPLPAEVVEFIRECAQALRDAPKGQVALYVGGEALLNDHGALAQAGLVAAACGAVLLGENAFARVDRGAGLPHVTRLPYFPQEAARELSKYKLLVTVDVKLPVANFGYAEGPSQLVPKTLLEQDAVWELDSAGQLAPGGVATVLHALACELNAGQRVKPGVNCGGLFQPLKPPSLPNPNTPLSPAVMCQCVAALQPEGCVVVDESLTSGGAYWDLSKGCPSFSHLTLTGGAIGSGPPMALGAAMACPDRWVINLQADGSAMYSLQALWSQAREAANVITIICANNTYNILRIECARQRIPGMGSATRRLTDLGQPVIDWQSLAEGLGVPACKARTAGEFCDALRHALTRQGPYLIQAML